MPLIFATVTIIAAAFMLFESYPQWDSYHAFADDRKLLGVPNFWNVAGNLVFPVVGIAGLRYLRLTNQSGLLPELRGAYIILFIGVFLTGFGSGWYHLEPNNQSLFWDRLPMTIAFMSLFAIIIGEHISASLARRLLWPLLIIGGASVFYWDYSESQGDGDLRFYGLVQFLPMLLIPAILLMYRSAFDRTSHLWMMIGLYVTAKVFEQLDVPVYGSAQIMSGHAIKHVLAALAPAVFLYGMMKRKRR